MTSKEEKSKKTWLDAASKTLGKAVVQTREAYKKSEIKTKVDAAVGTATVVADTVKETYEASQFKSQVNKQTETAKKILDDSGVSDIVGSISETATDQFDTVTGVKILALVEKRLELQAKYNDILAVKLEEALTRIQELETRINKQGES